VIVRVFEERHPKIVIVHAGGKMREAAEHDAALSRFPDRHAIGVDRRLTFCRYVLGDMNPRQE
jgi:hypothetical protein